MSTLSVGDLQGLAVNSNVVTVPTGHTLNVTDAAGLQIGGSAVVSAGLVLISSTTIGTAVSSVTVTDAFSSTFDNYRIVIGNCDASTGATDIEMTFGSTTTSYYYANIIVTLASGPTRVAGNNVSEFVVGKGDSASQTFISLDVFGPNIAQRTGISGIGHGVAQTYFVSGNLSTVTQYTAFTVAPASGTLTGGTIKVYGYNNG